MPTSSIDQLCIDTIRTLSIDAVEKANSGHPGAPMALAPVAYELWQHHLRFDPLDPIWPNRDRFVLSNGHASMLLYSLLHLAGVKQVTRDYRRTDKPAVSLDDIKNFRQLDSPTPGHPEYRLTTAVETTTGPLGQGVSTSVGMAAGNAWLAARYNRPGFELFNGRIWVLCGDGDMMEGVSSEAASLAGHLKLANLVWIYDSNRITIEGKTDLAFSEDVAERFRAYGWHTLQVDDANDRAALAKAYAEAERTSDRPTFITVKSHIGYGSPKKQDSAKAHGEPLGEEEIRAAKKFYGWPEDAQFLIPDGVREHFQANLGARGKKLREEWQRRFEDYRKQFPELADQLERMQKRELPVGWDKDLPVFPPDAKGIATRESGGKVLNALAKNHPWVIGGSADLAPSTKTLLTFEGAGTFSPTDHGGRNFHYGIREHGMAAFVNGLAITKIRGYGASFLTFTDYARPSIRLAALMEVPSLFVMTHDSIGLGEDGPTHQPIEHVMSLRMIPGLVVLRPADANEVTEAYRAIAKMKMHPTVLVLTRQAVPTFDRTKYGAASGLHKGAYVLADAKGGKPEVILIGTGSEVSLCVEAHEKLSAEGIRSRVVSMPSWELFDDQPESYRNEVLPPDVTARVSVEQGTYMGWERWVGTKGAMIGMSTFGASAPYKELAKKYGFTVDNVVKHAKQQLGRK
jgi:transketolase